jgi:hypothetical protein
MLSEVVTTFSTVFKGARSAPRALRRVTPRKVTRPGRGSDGRHARRAGTPRPQGRRGHLTGSSALAPAAHGGLPPERYPGHRPSPVGRRHARQARPGDGHPPRRSSLEPGESHRQGRRLRRRHGRDALWAPWTVTLPGSFWRRSGGWPGLSGARGHFWLPAGKRTDRRPLSNAPLRPREADGLSPHPMT